MENVNFVKKIASQYINGSINYDSIRQWSSENTSVFLLRFSANKFSSSARQVRKCEGSAEEALMCLSFSPDKLSFCYHQAIQPELFPINVSCLNLYHLLHTPLVSWYPQDLLLLIQKPFPTTLREFSVGFIGWLEIICSLCGKQSSHFCLSVCQQFLLPVVLVTSTTLWIHSIVTDSQSTKL